MVSLPLTYLNYVEEEINQENLEDGNNVTYSFENHWGTALTIE